LDHKTKVYEIISQNRYENGIGKIVGSLPTPDKVREEMEKHFKVSTKRNSIRIILVEDFGDYKIFLQIPDGKSKYNFYVWRALFEDSKIKDEDIKVPTHNDLAEYYTKLKSKPEIEKDLIKAVIKLIIHRWDVPEIISYYFNNLNVELKISCDSFKEIKIEKESPKFTVKFDSIGSYNKIG